jgi:hypothetical protein
VGQSQVLVAAVMKDRGYPTEHREQIAADLSVEHASMIDNFRSAEQISENAASGTASTEDLRQAMIHYRSMFRDLLGQSATTGAVTPGSPVIDSTATDSTATDSTVTDSTATRTEAPVTTTDGETTGTYETTAADDREAGTYDGEADGTHDGQATGAYDRRAADGELADGDVADDDLAADDPTTRTARRS